MFSSAAVWSPEVRSHSWAVFGHVWVLFNRCVLGHLHQIVTHNLAIRQSRIVSKTFLGHFIVAIKYAQRIHILGSHLSALYFLKQQSSCLVHCSHKGRTHIRRSITVNPSVFLHNSHKITHSHATLCHYHTNLRQFEVFSAKTLVQGLSQYFVYRELPKSLEVTEDCQDEVRVEQGRHVVFRGVDPSEQEVVVAVRIALHLLEKGSCLSHIEFASRLLRQRQHSHVHIAVQSPFFPLLPTVTLNAMLRPVPSILTLNHTEYSINFKYHSRMSSMRSCAILYDLIDTVEASNRQKVSRFDLVGRKVDEMWCSLLPPETSACLDEVDIEFLLIFRWFSSEKRNLRVGTQTTKEDLYSFEYIRDPVLE